MRHSHRHTKPILQIIPCVQLPLQVPPGHTVQIALCAENILLTLVKWRDVQDPGKYKRKTKHILAEVDVETIRHSLCMLACAGVCV